MTFTTALRLAAREMRGGLSGFLVFLACLAVGVMAIAAVGTVTRGLSEGVAREGRTILGGDIAFSLIHREASPRERAWFEAQGTVQAAATLAAMARTGDGSDQTLVEVKAVDDAYPGTGTLVLEPARPVSEVLATRAGVAGAAIEPTLAARLNLRVGDRVRIGDGELEIRAIITREPDRLGAGMALRPRVLTSFAGLEATRLVQPGSLVRYHYRIAAPGTSDARLTTMGEEATRLFPDAGWQVRTRANASPQLSQNLNRFSQFLTLVGLTALVVGGVGVANAVRAHVDARRDTIATLKALGATGRFVVGVYLIQTAMIAAVGIVAGLALGVALPAAALAAFGHLLPVPVLIGIYPAELGVAALYGALVALAFALWPLGRAHDVSVQALYRERTTDARSRPRLFYMIGVAAAILGLVSVAVALAADRRVALVYVGAAAAAFVVLRLVALGLMAIARRLPRPRTTGLRLALTNIHRPGALTPTVVLSLGLGLTLLVTLALIDGNLRRQLTAALPDRAPSFFFLDVPSSDLESFTTTLAREAPTARVASVPMLRGRIVALKGIPAEQYAAPSRAAWVLTGDRGITYADALPSNSTLVEGAWWTADYAGPPLVSFDARIARDLGLRLGDEVSVNVLGRTFTARIANLREVQWETLGINFVMVFSPNTFRGAPHTHLATLTYPGGATAAQEVALLRGITEAFPQIASVRVKEALEAVNGVVAQLAVAVRGASSVTLIAAVLVLGGALAAGHQSRIYDAVILKTLGATRARLVGAFALEYLALGLATAIFGVAVGTAAAWVVLTRVMDLPFNAMPEVAVIAVAGALAVTLAFGLFGTWRVLRYRPAPVLRSL